MNTPVTAAQHLSQPCGPLPVKDCRVRRFIWLTIYSQNRPTQHYRVYLWYMYQYRPSMKANTHYSLIITPSAESTAHIEPIHPELVYY